MIINNQDYFLVNEILSKVNSNSEILICSNNFSFNALFVLLDQFKGNQRVRIIINTSDLDNNKALFIHNPIEVRTDSALQGYYRLNTVLKKFQDSVEVRKSNIGGLSFVVIDEHVFMLAPNTVHEATLGIIKEGGPYLISYISDSQFSYKQTFNNQWNAAVDCKEELISLYDQANPLKPAHDIYQYTISKIFQDRDESDLKEERLTRTGFKSSVIWSKLFNFQKDAVLGAIDKIEKYNGCIIADSVGLGKTFEALAVIKYYELRNDRVLVLAPKKLRDNWIAYTKNYTTNILEKDRFNYDVLNHTDLGREGGLSGDIDLDKVHWGNYDLVVIDESHNFRNNNPSKDHVTRYERLMNQIICAGVKTKVLLLSATPVNTRLNDLKNQVAFITESNDQALKEEGITSIELTLRQAQTKFNNWLKDSDPSRDSLINRLDGDYFKLLDLLTISRSRKHIEKYYDVSDIGQFPERLKPKSMYSEFDTQDKEFSITYLNDQLQMLNLQFYSPLFFVHKHLQPKYAEKYDTITKNGTKFSQLEREESIITLMRVNLLKRLESSIHSFCLTLNSVLNRVNFLIEKIDNHKEFLDDVDIMDLDFDDEELRDSVIGGKVKVLLQDIDQVKMKGFLESDKAIIEKLLGRCEEITVSRDQKLQDLIHLIEEKIDKPLNTENKKVIVFSAFADTVRYLYDNLASYFQNKHQLNAAMVVGGDANKTKLIGCKTDLQSILTNFSPLSKSRDTVMPKQKGNIDLLFCTDCISEGQNLQDCDFLVNYDIHWNPVRIIQRFGRIDRIGSQNKYIQLVNFYPTRELDQYIDLVQRVKGRMQILDISATGDDNVIDERSGQQKELEYRKKQLERMRESVVDLEDLEGGISITDLTFNDFKIDAERISATDKLRYEQFASASFSLIRNNIVDHEAGVLFCVKDLNNTNFDEKLKLNLLHPYALIYINKDGEIIVPARTGKRALDLFKKLAFGKETIDTELLKEFNISTKSGRYMSEYTELLNVVKSHLSGEEKEAQISSIFNANAVFSGKSSSANQYEVLSYLIVSA
ncbi:DEAD/DEAH box helicase [Sphingobacterium hungaricum]|uniref:DEAD/DEAH box helicase n=1 Tax=Sphingobacterium hungaricum TaxID=2082723 RepID=A0A928UZM5_9SPHI|nr:DEAD/DEAH box helicase [Sphingobacterium hungaricum]MBE8714365.1 DEAD/DEAH box helicase [Sphingobacterium hungaricum]